MAGKPYKQREKGVGPSLSPTCPDRLPDQVTPTKRHGWTAVPNALLESTSLSSDGVRLVCWLISHKSEFELRRDYIGQKLALGEHRLRKAIKEAKAAGYLKTVEERCKRTGRLRSRYQVSPDGRFSTSGKATSIRTPNKSSELVELEAAFCSAFPAAPTEPHLFRRRLAEAVCQRGLENVLTEAERYALEVASRRQGGRVARPENWLWRLLYGHLCEVIETDAA